MRTLSDLWRKFQRAAYRKAFVGAEVKRVIPFQISAIRKLRGWSQEELARRSGLTQGVISRSEDPDYGNLTLNTVIKIANGFDVAFVGKFVPYSELANWYSSMSETSAGDVADFDKENEAVAEIINAELASSDQLRIADAIADYLRKSKRQQMDQGTEQLGPLGIPLAIPADLVGGGAYGNHGHTHC